MEGKEVRFGAALRRLGCDYDGDIERVGQFDARLAHAAGRADADDRMAQQFGGVGVGFINMLVSSSSRSSSPG
jgi:hypothetical protein